MTAVRPARAAVLLCYILNMYTQFLPEYRTDFLTAPWLVYATAHYRFHFFAHSLAENEIEHISITQEGAYNDILAFLSVPQPEKNISYYLYPDADTKKNLMGSQWFAQSIYDSFEIHALYTNQHRVIGAHEDTHLLSLPLGLPIGFIAEGLAERMVGHDWFGNPFLETARSAVKRNEVILSNDLLTSHSSWLATPDEYARQYYAVAALFCNFLIEQYGKQTYFELYRTLDRNAQKKENDAAYESVLGTPLERVYNNFLQIF